MHESSKAKCIALKAIQDGASQRKAASKAGVRRSAVRRWCKESGICFAVGCKGGAIVSNRHVSDAESKRLTLAHRLAIAIGIAANESHACIAQGIGFSRTTVSRELSRHRTSEGGYDPYEAQLRAEHDARRPKARKTDVSMRLRRYVLGKLALRFSPMQISKQLERDFPNDKEMRVSHEAIYQALYVQGKGALRQELKLEKALRSGRKTRLPQSRLASSRGEAKSWVEGCEIALRPPEAEDRAVPGHWEGDLVIGSDMRSCLITLVERTTRLALIRRLEMHPSKLVTSELADMVSDVPSALMRTITWDQGTEMATHADFTDRTGVKVYFCDPHSPWQRGTNENTNGLIRDYFPKGTDFTKVTDGQVREMQDQLNIRPRQTLGWKSPAEAYAELLQNDRSAMTA